MMIENILKFLTSKLILLFVLFFLFIFFVLVIFHLIYPEKIIFSENYILLIHFLVLYLNVYLILYIWKTQDFYIDSRYLYLVAMNLLIYTAFYVLVGDKKTAEQLSIWAYYFLLLGVVVELLLLIYRGKFLKNNSKTNG